MGKPLRFGDPLVKCFVPKGRTAATIYAVAIKDQPGVTKVGRTQRWNSRRRAYDYWNLAPGDAVVDFRTYTFIEDYVDLEGIERHVLATLPFPLRFGKEWFDAPFDDVAPHLDEIIDALGFSYM